MRKLLMPVYVSLLVSVTPTMAAENLNFNADLGVVTDNNVTKAQNDEDILEDTFISGSAGLSYTQELSFRSLLLYRGDVALESYQEFDGLDNIALKGAIDYKIQFSRGYTAPGYTLTGFIEEYNFESEIRSSTILGVQGTMAKRFTDRMATTIGLGYRDREAESDVFDTQNARIFGNLDWVLSDQFMTYGTLQYVVGDIVSTARPTLEIIVEAEAIEPDDAFGGPETGFFAYRLADADTTLFTLGLNYGINRGNSLDASLELLNSEAGSISYDRTVFRLSYLGVF